MIMDGKELEFFGSVADFYGNKPPRETVTLTSDCRVESRKLPLKSKAPTTPDSPSPYSDSVEPDSVIDIQLSTKGGGTVRVITLQCYSIEEENRWISHLQASLIYDGVMKSTCLCGSRA